MRRTRQYSRLTLLASALLLGATACKDDVTPAPTPSALSAVGASTFTSLVGEVQTVRVVVTDASAKPLPNATVTFNVVDGGGTIAPTSVITSTAGEASAIWTLGSATGLQRAQAQVGGVPSVVTFVATTLPGAPASVAVSAGDNQSTQAGNLVTTSPAVIVKDRFGNNVPNVSVFFTVTSGGGSVTSSGASTGNNGIATVAGWRLGNSVGINRLTALALVSGATGNPVVFTANALAGAASTLSANSATSLTGTVGTTVTPLPSVRVLDAGGNPVSGAQVTFQGSAGSSTSGSIKLTDATGTATLDSWLLGTAAQNYTVTATSGALTPVVFTAAARTGAASAVSLFAGGGQSAFTGRPVATEPAVRVTDGFGNPIAGLEVVFDVTSGGGVAVARRQVTNANGVAEVGGWTLGDNVGTNTLRATVTSTTQISGNPVIFTATATPGLPATVTLVAGGGQIAAISTIVPIRPSVIVRDSRGNPVSGTTVSFQVTGGGGSITGANPITDVNGIATVGSWTLGPSAGPQTLVARIFGLPDVTFTASATGGTPASAVAVSVADLGTFPVGGFATPLPVVRVRDASGNPVSGATVTFTPDVGQSSLLTGAVQTTDINGLATLGSWSVGSIPGVTLRVRAFVTGLDQLGLEPTFIARTTAATATTMLIAPGAVSNQIVAVSTAVPTLPAIRLTDAGGNPVVGAIVQFSTSSGSGTVTGSLQATDSNGIARVGGWTTPATPGIITMTVILGSNTAITLSFTVTVQ